MRLQHNIRRPRVEDVMQLMALIALYRVIRAPVIVVINQQRRR